MSRARFFLTDTWEHGPLPLTSDDLYHLTTVLRGAVGDEVVGISPDGVQRVVRLTAVSSDAVSGMSVERLPDPWLPTVVLVQGISKNPRMDTVVEKATELGVSRIVPLATERCVVRLEGDRALERRERWERVAEAAAKQSRRPSLPRVGLPMTVQGLERELGGVSHVLVCDEDAETPGIGGALREADARSDDSVAVVVGPEGGLTDSEIEAIEALGGRTVTMGPTILRAETAGAVAVALVSYELGGLGGRNGPGAQT
jgi:16S rRNA (uracil1498-N3)-methyltransferase